MANGKITQYLLFFKEKKEIAQDFYERGDYLTEKYWALYLQNLINDPADIVLLGRLRSELRALAEYSNERFRQREENNPFSVRRRIA